MICYKDRTWCPHEDCKRFGAGCDRSLTPDVIARAAEWWGGPEAPIAVWSEHPGCFELDGGRSGPEEDTQ